jgi:asparagine synthase (glutamine-hydrolysing)
LTTQSAALYGVLDLGASPSPDALDRMGAPLEPRQPPARLHDGPLRLACTGDLAQTSGCVVALVGELDNAAALRSAIGAGDGIDGGALVGELYRRHGDACVTQLRGIFAVAIWDPARKTLLLNTDRSGGLRPLYWCRTDSALVFGTRLETVLAHPEVPREADPASLFDLFSLGFVIGPRTTARGVELLLAGTTLVAGPEGVQAVQSSPRSVPRAIEPVAIDDLYDTYLARLRRAVRQALDTDPELGVLSSGGLDSAALVSLLREAGHDGMRTYSIHLDDDDEDRRAAERVAELYGARHVALTRLGDASLDELPRMIWCYQAPTQEIHPTYLVTARARQDVRTVLNGFGNDNIYGLVWPGRNTGSPAARRALRTAERQFVGLRRQVPASDVARLLGAGAPPESELLERVHAFALDTDEPLNDVIVLDAAIGQFWWTHVCGRLTIDAQDARLAMPYEDPDVEAVVHSLPTSLKLHREGPTLERKHFFRQLMRARGIVPDEIIDRPKTWMRSPSSEWLRGPFGRTAEAIVLGRSARRRPYFDLAFVERCFSEHRAGTVDHKSLLMLLLGFELWHRLFLDTPIPSPPRALLRDFAD